MRKLTYILLIFCYSIYGQTTYYVSPSGSDLAAGTSQETAWQTISKVNSSSFNPGDSILFERGGLWRESLDVPSSGTSGAYITFSNYGTGPIPKIFGSDVLNSFSAHGTYSNVYYGTTTIPINPYDFDASIYHGAIFFKMNDSTTWGDAYAANLGELDVNYEYFWQNDTIYFYYDGSINDIDSVECAQRNRGINISEEYITIDGFEIKYHCTRNIGTLIYPELTTHGVQIRNCRLAYTGIREGGVGYGIQLFHSNAIVENNVMHDNGRRNLSMNIVDQTTSVTFRDVVIQDNYLYNGWHTTGVDIAIQGLNHTVRNIVIRRNKIYDPPEIDKSAYNVTGNFFENNGDAGDYDSLFFYNNLVLNQGRPAIQLAGIGDAFVCNNTFVGAPQDITGLHSFIYHGFTGNSTIMNNIFFNTSPANALYCDIRGTTGGASTTFDTVNYNLYYHLSVGNPMFSEFPEGQFNITDWATIQGYGYEVNSPDPALPNFFDSTSDYRIKESSPAVYAGYPISFITTDYAGTERNDTAPSIGAYEYVYVNDTIYDTTLTVGTNFAYYVINATELTGITTNGVAIYLINEDETDAIFIDSLIVVYDTTGAAACEELSFSGSTVSNDSNSIGTGSIDLSVSGGSSPYAYQWTPGGETSQDISGLSAGTYSVTVMDAGDCYSDTSFIVVNFNYLTDTINYNTDRSLNTWKNKVNAGINTLNGYNSPSIDTLTYPSQWSVWYSKANDYIQQFPAIENDTLIYLQNDLLDFILKVNEAIKQTHE